MVKPWQDEDGEALPCKGKPPRNARKPGIYPSKAGEQNRSPAFCFSIKLLLTRD